MELLDKLAILADAAKYDAACTSSGVRRGSRPGMIGNTTSSVAGCCHSFSADGRCITLLKVLMTNRCVYDCKYCVNRRSHDTRRAAFTPRELAELTIEFYRRNYIEGLFLSSGVLRSPEESMVERIALREAIDALPEREKMTILLRFFKGLTQEQTARILGVSQVQVSRLERRGLANLRKLLDD